MSLPADGSNERDAERGQRAREVLDNPIYAEAFGTLEQEMYRLWRESRDERDREQLHRFLLTLGKVQNALETVMRTGELSQAKLLEDRSRAEQIGAEYQRRWAA